MNSLNSYINQITYEEDNTEPSHRKTAMSVRPSSSKRPKSSKQPKVSYKPIMINLSGQQKSNQTHNIRSYNEQPSICPGKLRLPKFAKNGMQNGVTQQQMERYLLKCKSIRRQTIFQNNLAKNLSRMEKNFPDDYNFFPKTFVLPHESSKLKAFHSELRNDGLSPTYIVKPEGQCQGRGIILIKNPYELATGQHCVIQQYIASPLLYKGLKFDIRVYVLITSCSPLCVFIYNEGLVRLATDKYQSPNYENIENKCMHLTNYSVNKDNPKYVFNESINNLSYGHKKSLAQFFSTIKSLGFNAQYYWAQIKDIIIKTMISSQPHLQHQYKICQPNSIDNMCFELLGFDFIIDGMENVFLLQVNHTPSFSTDTPLDQLIKGNVVRDTLILLNATVKQRNQIIKKFNDDRLDRVRTGSRLSSQNRISMQEQMQAQREAYQNSHLGNYERIYPSQDKDLQNKYFQFLQYSLCSYRALTGQKSAFDLRRNNSILQQKQHKAMRLNKSTFRQGESQHQKKTKLQLHLNHENENVHSRNVIKIPQKWIDNLPKISKKEYQIINQILTKKLHGHRKKHH